MQIEELKDKLYHSIQKYGLTDPRTVKISQQLDIPVTIEQIKKVKEIKLCGLEVKIKKN